MSVGKFVHKGIRALDRRRREVRMFAAAMHHRTRPVLAPILFT